MSLLPSHRSSAQAAGCHMRSPVGRAPGVRAVSVLACISLVSIILGGCFAPGTQPRVAGGGSADLRAGVVPPAGDQVPAPPRATLAITVRWPDRDRPGFQAALIPVTTQTLRVRVAQGATPLAERLVPRDPGAATATASLVVDAGDNVAIDVKAFREALPDETSQPIAKGAKAGLNLVPGKTTPVTIKLDALFLPGVTVLGTNVGAVGDKIAINGKNFGSGDTPVTVRFGDAAATAVSRKSDSELVATVPEGAHCGPIVVVADGVPSVPTATFWVATGAEIGAPKAFWDYQDPRTRMVLFGATLPFSATPSFALPDGNALVDTPPGPRWSQEGDAGAIADSGVFTAGSAYKNGKVRASYGSAGADLAVSVQDVAVSMTASANRVGLLGYESLRLGPIHTFSDGATASFFAFSSAASDTVAVSEGGVVTAADDESNATVAVKATSRIVSSLAVSQDIMLKNRFTKVETLAGRDPERDGTGTAATFRQPGQIARDDAGNLYVTASGTSNLIRKITPAGVVTTIGSQTGGQSNGELASARFLSPQGMAATGSLLYVADYGNAVIRKIDLAAGTVTTLAGPPPPVQEGFSDGQGAAARFKTPRDIAIARNGDLFVADSGNYAIRKITPAGVVTTLAGGSEGTADGTGTGAQFYGLLGITVDPDGVLYVADYVSIRKVTPAGQVTTLVTKSDQLPAFYDVAHEASGSLVAAIAGQQLARVFMSGAFSTLVQPYDYQDGLLETAYADQPEAVAADVSGVVYFTDKSRRVRKIAGGQVSTIAGSGGPARDGGSGTDGPAREAAFTGIEQIGVSASGRVIISDYRTGHLRYCEAGKVGSIESNRIGWPAGSAFDLAGNLYVAGMADNRIWKIKPSGAMSSFAGSGQYGHVDGDAATAQFRAPHGIGFGPDGFLYVADAYNYCIRKVSPAGEVSTLAGSLADESGRVDGLGPAARFNFPTGVAVDMDGTAYVADLNNSLVRRIAPDGQVTTLAGGAPKNLQDGTGTGAAFSGPSDVAVDVRGNVYVADRFNNAIRMISRAGVVTTITGKPGFLNGALDVAQFNYPNGIRIGPDGEIFVSDYFNYQIRVIR